MMDVVGVSQHHDGISGTAKQHVSDNYMSKIATGINATNWVFADIIDKYSTSAGVQGGSWTQCQRTNGTWEDCPISYHADQKDLVMTVATYNPSNLAMYTIDLKVPHSNFTARSFNGEQWQDAVSSVICNQQQQELDPSSEVTNCNMFVT